MSEETHCVGHEPCPQCGSRDNLARYSDGHAFCFSEGCGHYEHSSGEVNTKPRKTSTRPGMIEGEILALPKRGLSEQTCKVWNYRIGEHNGKPCQIATYCDDGGRPVAQKLRFPDKSFTFVGDPKATTPLFGQHLWRDGGKMVVVTEGEIDALSVSQLQDNKWPVVSVRDGAAGAHKGVAAALEWLLRFDKVIFMLDDDEPGKNAAKKCAALLPPGRAYIASIHGFKDANDALKAGQGRAVIDAIWNAKEYRPDGIVGVGSVIERAAAPVAMGLSWPWDELTRLTYGRRRGEVYGFGAGTGCGKTTLFKQIQAHILQHDKLPIAVIALEEPVHHSAKTLAGVIDGVRYHVPGVEYDRAKLRTTLEWMDGKAYFYDHFGAATFDAIKDKVRYMAHSLGCKDIFIDHLTALAATMDDDERKAIDKMMAELSAIAIELDVTIYFISHLSTPDGKPHEEGGRVLEKHFRGSRAIGYWSHFLFGIERDKQNPQRPSVFRVLKDRYTGDSAGLTFGLRYNRDTGRLDECPLEDAEGPFKDEGTANDF